MKKIYCFILICCMFFSFCAQANLLGIELGKTKLTELKIKFIKSDHYRSEKEKVYSDIYRCFINSNVLNWVEFEVEKNQTKLFQWILQ